MAKGKQNYLDIEAMKLGLKEMLNDVNLQLDCGDHSDAIVAVLIDRKTHIEKRLEELG